MDSTNKDKSASSEVITALQDLWGANVPEVHEFHEKPPPLQIQENNKCENKSGLEGLNKALQNYKY